MAYLWVFVSVLALTLRQITALSISDIPHCAEAALPNLLSTGCELTDTKCICRDQSLVTSLLPVVKNDCSPEDFQKTIAITESFCDDVGITITVPTSTPITTPTPATTPTPTTTPTPATTPTPTTTPTPATTSTLTTTSTGTPRSIPTSRITPEYQTHDTSGAHFNKSTSAKPTVPTNTTVTTNSKPSAFTGAAARHYAGYVWAGTLFGMAALPLL